MRKKNIKILTYARINMSNKALKTTQTSINFHGNIFILQHEKHLRDIRLRNFAKTFAYPPLQKLLNASS